MFQIVKNDKTPSLKICRTATSIAGKPLMWAYFYVYDNFIIDSGNPNCDRKALAQFFRSLDVSRKWVLINTHCHEDHCGNNDLAVKILNARVIIPEPVRKENFSEVSLLYRIYWGTPKIFPHEHLDTDHFITDAGHRIKVLKTPGHTLHHTSFILEDEAILIAGDAIPVPSRKTVTLEDEDYIGCISSLKLLRGIADRNLVFAASHSGILKNPVKTIEDRISAMEGVVADVEAIREKGEERIRSIAKMAFGRQTWFDLFTGRRMNTRLTVKSILRKK